MFQRLILIAICVAATAVPASSLAQYQIDWYTIDGGGGTSTGGQFSLSGTIGQPDAEVVSLCSADGGVGCVNPTYELSGGFWAGIQGEPQGPGTGCGAELNCLFRDGFEF